MLSLHKINLVLLMCLYHTCQTQSSGPNPAGRNFLCGRLDSRRQITSIGLSSFSWFCNCRNPCKMNRSLHFFVLTHNCEFIAHLPQKRSKTLFLLTANSHRQVAAFLASTTLLPQPYSISSYSPWSIRQKTKRCIYPDTKNTNVVKMHFKYF